MNKTNNIIANCTSSHPFAYVLPDNHTRAPDTASFAFTTNTWVAADPKAEIAIPINATNIGWKLLFQEVIKIILNAKAAPTIAPSGKYSTGTAGNITNRSIAPAPPIDVTPSTLASASGFRNTPCNNTPVIASIIPTIKAVNTRGIRKFHMTGFSHSMDHDTPL